MSTSTKLLEQLLHSRFKLADRLVLDRNPLENIRHTESVHMVMTAARVTARAPAGTDLAHRPE